MTADPNSGTAASDIERAIRERGRVLLDAVAPERLVTLSPEWWQDRLMEWASQDPDFRVKLLRFVDVLPTLRSSKAIADHVRQYFHDDSPPAVRIGSSIGRRGIFRPVLSRVVRQGVFSMAHRFIIAPNPRKALPRLRELVESGTAFTIDLLGEATLSDREADAYRDRYLSLLEALGGETGSWKAEPELRKPNVSIKLSALTAHFEPASPEATYESLGKRLVAVMGAARRTAAFVNVDMEQYRYRDLIHDVLERLIEDDEFRRWPDLGMVVQAYLEDSPDDIARLESLARERGAPITVRLVKGAYWDEEMIVARQNDYSPPVFEEKVHTDASFERCTARLVAAYPHLRPAFASHNPRSIAQAMVRVEAAGIPREHVEFQMLFGMAEGLRAAVGSEGYRTRVYVPAGEIIPGMGYLVRRLLENTSNESWVVSKHEEADPEVALRPPAGPGGERPPSRSQGFRNQSPLELYRPGVREAMAEAIRRVRESFGRDHLLLVDGKSRKSDEWIEVRCPAAPTTVMGRVAAAKADHVDAAVASARRGFQRWRDAGSERRAAVLRRAAELMASSRCELAAIMIFESGKPWREADGDVTEAIDFLRYYADQAERLGAGIDLTKVPGETNQCLYEPRGVVGVISPWNFPLAIPCGMTSGALAAGNAVVLKPAHQSPIIAGRLVSILRDAGVPEAALHYLPGRGAEAGQRLVGHPDVDMVAFTGSNAVGRAIALSAAEVRPGQRALKKVLAELGGKNAIIVDDDADLDLAVEGVVASAFGYAGQKCSAASRVVVVGSAYEEFRDRLAAAVESLAVGPPEDPYTVVPPVISAEARARIESYVAIGEAEGRLVAKGPIPAGEGHYVAPHVFEEISPESKLAREEVFGPVLALFRADDFEEATAAALDSPFALTGGVYSRNPRHIAIARERFRVGNLYLNRRITGAAVGRQPFGGFKMSGTDDKAGGPDYVRQFTLARVVTENTMRRGFAPVRGAGSAE